MNKNRLLTFTALSLTLTTFSFAAKMTAVQIMTQNEENRRVNDFQAKASLSTGAVGATPKIKTFTLSRKVQKDGIHNSTLTRFHTPAEVRDEGILIIENKMGQNDVMLYLPNFKKTRRVESQQQSGSFMGSVFSYSDIATPHVEDYEYKEIKTEPCPTAEAKGIKCHVIECTPINDTIRERTGYSKSILWMRSDNFMGVYGQYFDLAGQQFKSFESAKIKLVDTAKNKWLAHEVTMTHLKNNEYTKLEFSNVVVNKGISDSVFTQQNLQKIK